jgi:8-oxo-dGTP pyrophosphatase MutT (NUDIX family)
VKTIDLARLTVDQPFCAGVVLIRDRLVLGTLNTDGIPDEFHGKAWRVGGVGGGQEPGESPWACAEREAREETGISVSLKDSRASIFHDIDNDEFEMFQHTGPGPAPVLLERKTLADATTPFKPGLPTGEFLYLVLFLAGAPRSAELAPCDDVVALIGLSIDAWIRLPTQMPTVRSALLGAKLFGGVDLDQDRILWTPPDESFVSLARAISDRGLHRDMGL